jgi:hypothetical protein
MRWVALIVIMKCMAGLTDGGVQSVDRAPVGWASARKSITMFLDERAKISKSKELMALWKTGRNTAPKTAWLSTPSADKSPRSNWASCQDRRMNISGSVLA